MQNISMWITRKYEKTLKAMSWQFPALVVTGPRQVGKTALVRKVFPNADYVSLDLPSIASQAETVPEEFFQRYGSPLIIDEVQYAPSLSPGHIAPFCLGGKSFFGQFLGIF